MALLGSTAAGCTRPQIVGLSERLDPPLPAGPSPSRSCTVGPDLEGPPGPCSRYAPPRAFEPTLKWSWNEETAPTGYRSVGSNVTPLVGNLTDDDGNGRIDLCDVPDVVVVTHRGDAQERLVGRIVVLAGDTGTLQAEMDPGPLRQIAGLVTPALGDLDGDGLPEVVTVDPGDGRLLIFDHRGRLARVSPDPVSNVGPADICSVMALHDLDADGSPEIVFGATDVFDASGRRRFGNDLSSWFTGLTFAGSHCLTAAAADLDEDGRLEIVLGNAAFRADGTRLWRVADRLPGHPHIANFDADPQPEILLHRAVSTLLLEHDGAVKFRTDPLPHGCVARPAAVDQLDGRGSVDVTGGSCGRFYLFEVGASALHAYRSFMIRPPDMAASTTFDFLGRGHAQAITSDTESLFAFDGKSGALELHLAGSSVETLLAYPVVADVDNDGSADLVLVSSRRGDETEPGDPPPVPPRPPVPTVQVFQDRHKRWMATRRIWNQHAYQVTNVREDGTIPRVPARHWLGLNTFRSNAQIEQDRICRPLVHD
jgi:hypothetical protein